MTIRIWRAGDRMYWERTFPRRGQQRGYIELPEGWFPIGDDDPVLDQIIRQTCEEAIRSRPGHAGE